MKPKLLEIGSTIDESRELLQSHNDLFTRLASKQDQVEGLLSRADQLVAEQTEQDDVIVYEAMAEGLGAAWRELTRQLELRGFILNDTLDFYQMADKHEHLTKECVSLVKQALKEDGLVQEAQQHISGNPFTGKRNVHHIGAKIVNKSILMNYSLIICPFIQKLRWPNHCWLVTPSLVNPTDHFTAFSALYLPVYFRADRLNSASCRFWVLFDSTDKATWIIS